MDIVEERELQVSQMAEELVGSEIIKLAGEVKSLIAQGEKINNLTIGDFNPEIFPIPELLRNHIIDAYKQGHTNYPAANGIPELRNSVRAYLKRFGQLDYSADEILIAGGARPLIYAAYQTLIDSGDKVIFPVPSWNNNHYTHLSHGNPVFVETTVENNFMPSAADLEPHISGATLIAVCSPLNPTGTTFSKKDLEEICDLVIAENNRRAGDEKPLYLLYDQIYWMLKHGDTQHYDPVSLRPEMRNYTIYIDGISKAFAGTGVRVGWAFGPQKIVNKMKAILGHIGAWAPKAEQVATAQYLSDHSSISAYNLRICTAIYNRLSAVHNGIQSLKDEGFSIDSIEPEAAMYLTVNIDLIGKRTPNGKVINSVEETTEYILKSAGLAIVPFYAFGAPRDASWYRLSVGTLETANIDSLITRLREAFNDLQ